MLIYINGELMYEIANYVVKLYLLDRQIIANCSHFLTTFLKYIHIMLDNYIFSSDPIIRVLIFTNDIGNII